MGVNLCWENVALEVVSRFTPNQKKFVAEIVGTFIIVVLATSAVVIDIKFSGTFGIAFLPLVGVAHYYS